MTLVKKKHNNFYRVFSIISSNFPLPLKLVMLLFLQVMVNPLLCLTLGKLSPSSTPC